MQVQTSVDEADIGKVKKDQRVEFTVDAYPDLKFEGTVSEVRLQASDYQQCSYLCCDPECPQSG